MIHRPWLRKHGHGFAELIKLGVFVEKTGSTRGQVARAVGWAVEDGIGVVEDVFGTEGLLKIASAVGDEGQPQALFQLDNKGRVEVWSASARAGAGFVKERSYIRIGI